MGRKRHGGLVDVESSIQIDDSDFEDQEQFGFGAHDIEKPDTDDDLDSQSQDSDSSDFEEMNAVLYDRCLKQYSKFKKLKKKLSKSLNPKEKKSNSDVKSKDAFTRFSVTYFSKVINALSAERKDIINKCGFGSLLKFQKCFVPNKFSSWVAQQIDFKSGDIIYNDKVISLTKESVNLVLDLPIGGRPFPSDVDKGKSFVLSRFQKTTIPNVKFFGDKLVNNVEMSDQDVFICFIMVALNCFLCPNSSLVPSTKYLGIFEDIESAKDLDWSAFVLQWLLDGIESFRNGKNRLGKEKNTLSGCLYYCAVFYLDFVDFGQRQLPPVIPRILVWKDNLITTYSKLHKKSDGEYGLRPLMDISRTCYSKQSIFLHKPSPSLSLDSDFMDNLDIYSGCNLPESLKIDICKLLEDHSFKSSLCLNMNVTSLANLSDEMKKTFSTLLEHVYHVDSRTQSLVLKLLKMISDACPPEDAEGVVSPTHTTQSLFKGNSNMNQNTSIPQDNQVPSSDNKATTPSCNIASDCGHINEEEAIHLSNNTSHSNLNMVSNVENSSQRRSSFFKDSSGRQAQNSNTFTPTRSNAKLSTQEVDHLMKKLSKDHSQPGSSKSLSNFVIPPSGYPPERCPSAIVKKHKARLELTKNYITESEIAKLRDPFCDISNISDSPSYKIRKSVSFAPTDCNTDVILLEKVCEIVPDSISPSPRNGLSKFMKSQDESVFDQSPYESTQQTPITMLTLEDSHDSFDHVTPNIPRPTPNLTPKSWTQSKRPRAEKTSPEVEITGERNLFGVVNELSKRSEQMYNSKLNSANPSSGSHCATANNGAGCSDFKRRDSSTAGKPPHYGPRRVIYPNPKMVDHVSNTKTRFPVSQSEVANYHAICSLASSKWKDEHAVNIGGVHCTFRSFGDSLKSRGVVSNFLVAVFCRHLFMKPDGHPDTSKRHYFFSNIGDNLLKHPDEANQKTLENAFKRSKRARPLHLSNLLFFPIYLENHWFVFVVDIKDHLWVFLDSYYTQDSEYHRNVRNLLIPSFQLHWDQYVEFVLDDQIVDMKFDEYDYAYPAVPRIQNNNMYDSGIIAMMCLEHWKSPRTQLSSIFDISDIARIRVKIANNLMFLPHNFGSKRLVIGYNDKEDDD